MADSESRRVEYQVDVFTEQADINDPVAVARAAYSMFMANDAMLPILTVWMPEGNVDVDLEEVGLGDD